MVNNDNEIRLSNGALLAINLNSTEANCRLSIQAHMKRNGITVKPYILKCKIENDEWISFDFNFTLKDTFETARRRQNGQKLVILHLEVPPSKFPFTGVKYEQSVEETEFINFVSFNTFDENVHQIKSEIKDEPP